MKVRHCLTTPFFSLCCKRKCPSSPCNRGCPISLELGLQWPQNLNCGVRVDYNAEKPAAAMVVTELWEMPVSLAISWRHGVSIWLNPRSEDFQCCVFSVNLCVHSIGLTSLWTGTPVSVNSSSCSDIWDQSVCAPLWQKKNLTLWKIYK